MNDAPDQPARLSPVATAEWSMHVDGILRGLAHALNNRAAALSAVIELSSVPAEPSSVIRDILDGEVSRLRELSGMARLLGAQRGGVEAFSPRDAVAEAQAILAFHPDLVPGSVVMNGEGVPPIRVPRWMFVRTLLALALGLRSAGASRDGGGLTLQEEAEWLVVAAAGHPPRSSITVLASELARAMGGEPLEGRYGVRVPTLAALRRREGR